MSRAVDPLIKEWDIATDPNDANMLGSAIGQVRSNIALRLRRALTLFSLGRGY